MKYFRTIKFDLKDDYCIKASKTAEILSGIVVDNRLTICYIDEGHPLSFADIDTFNYKIYRIMVVRHDDCMFGDEKFLTTWHKNGVVYGIFIRG